MEPAQLLLIPNPRNVKILGGFAELGRTPFTVQGVTSEFISVMNKCCGSLPSIEPQHNGVVFTAFTASLDELSGPDILIRISLDFVSPLSGSSEGQFNSTNRKIRAETYKLTIKIPVNPTHPQIVIDASTKSGARHAMFTLIQLLRQFGNNLPLLIIDDAPVFPIRGVMLDVSRDRVPKQDELLKIVDLLASFKINHLQLYTEHTFGYAGHEEVWKNSSPLLPSEIRELDERCVERGIALAANQNCFGHMHRWLKHDTYRHLAELTGDWNFNGFKRSGPFSLCPIDPGSTKLVEDLLDQLVPCFSSGLVNIGCDETYDVGQGRSATQVKNRGEFDVYWDYVSSVMNIVRNHSARPMFWADMWLGSKAKNRDKIPEDSIGLAWGYEPDSDFTRWCKSLDAENRNVWVCPGTSSWRSITGRTNERKANISRAVTEGIQGGANGALITDWGDLGHRQQWPISLNGIVEAANAFWSGGYDDDYEKAISLHAFGDRDLSVSQWLNKLGNVDSMLREVSGKPSRKGGSRHLRNSSCMFVDMETPIQDKPFGKKVEGWMTILENLDKIASLTPRLDNQQVSDELRLSVETAIFACERAILRHRRNEMFTKKPTALIKKLNEIIAEHRRLWSLRSRPGGLEDSSQYYKNTLTDLTENG